MSDIIAESKIKSVKGFATRIDGLPKCPLKVEVIEMYFRKLFVPTPCPCGNCFQKYKNEVMEAKLKIIKSRYSVMNRLNDCSPIVGKESDK
jgi:hypothetical protein